MATVLWAFVFCVLTCELTAGLWGGRRSTDRCWFPMCDLLATCCRRCELWVLCAIRPMLNADCSRLHFHCRVLIRDTFMRMLPTHHIVLSTEIIQAFSVQPSTRYMHGTPVRSSAIDTCEIAALRDLIDKTSCIQLARVNIMTYALLWVLWYAARHWQAILHVPAS